VSVAENALEDAGRDLAAASAAVGELRETQRRGFGGVHREGWDIVPGVQSDATKGHFSVRRCAQPAPAASMALQES
jgi:hypothetical protein